MFSPNPNIFLVIDKISSSPNNLKIYCTLANNIRRIRKNGGSRTITVKCKGCGGINTIRKGAVSECEYCGSPIKGE